MADVELRLLRTFATVVDVGTFGKAAQALGYTQSTVSQQVVALERAVGGALFDRPGGPRPVRLTPMGSLVLNRGRELLTGAAELADAIERFRAGGGRVDIGTFQSVSAVILPSLVRRLREEQPDCEIRLFEEEPESPQMGDLDLLFYDGPVAGQVESVKLLDDPYVVVARHGDFADGPVPLVELDGRPMVAWPETCDQPRMERELRGSGCSPRVMFRSASNETVLAMVRSGMGFAILPRLAVEGAASASDPHLRVHDLTPAPWREVYLHWPSDRTLSPLAVRAVEIARESADPQRR